MSGISGIFRRDGLSLSPEELQITTSPMTHRGPDGIHAWTSGPIGLTHLMLWTTPESLLEKMPAKNSTGNLVITADARIDNRDELTLLLGWQGRSIEKITDSEFILGAYETWGEDCVNRLVGDFAFAIWDQNQQTLFCARDHMGVKPFYYYQSTNCFAFASEIKGLLEDDRGVLLEKVTKEEVTEAIINMTKDLNETKNMMLNSYRFVDEKFSYPYYKKRIKNLVDKSIR